MRETDFFLLLYIAQRTRITKSINTSTSEIASQLQLSQQSISRKLRNLEEQDMIKRNVSPAGIEISLTRGGVKILRTHFSELKKLFSKTPETIILQGIVESGLGEGKYYVSQPQYKIQFKEKLLFTPLEGTLNIRVDELQLQTFVDFSKPIKVSGFKTKQRSFGSINCYRVTVNDTVNAALIIPERTTHTKNTAELIAPISIRKKFNLKDGQTVKVKLK